MNLNLEETRVWQDAFSRAFDLLRATNSEQPAVKAAAAAGRAVAAFRRRQALIRERNMREREQNPSPSR